MKFTWFNFRLSPNIIAAGAAHMLPVEQPAAFCAAMTEFLG